MSITTNPQGTFTIEYEYRDDDSPLELYRVEYWTVSSVLLDRVIHNFSSTQVQRAHEEHYGEITNVVFSVDGLSLVIYHRDGEPRYVPLPVAFHLSDEENELILSYADGTKKRESLMMSNLSLYRLTMTGERLAYWERAAYEELEALKARLQTGHPQAGETEDKE